MIAGFLKYTPAEMARIQRARELRYYDRLEREALARYAKSVRS